MFLLIQGYSWDAMLAFFNRVSPDFIYLKFHKKHACWKIPRWWNREAHILVVTSFKKCWKHIIEEELEKTVVEILQERNAMDLCGRCRHAA